MFCFLFAVGESGFTAGWNKSKSDLYNADLLLLKVENSSCNAGVSKLSSLCHSWPVHYQKMARSLFDNLNTLEVTISF